MQRRKVKQKTRSRLGSGLGYNVKTFVQRGLTERQHLSKSVKKMTKAIVVT